MAASELARDLPMRSTCTRRGTAAEAPMMGLLAEEAERVMRAAAACS